LNERKISARQFLLLGTVFLLVAAKANGTLFTDDFEDDTADCLPANIANCFPSGGAAGISWAAVSPDPGTLGKKPVVSSDIAHSGSHSLKFEFAGSAVGGQAQSEQWFVLPDMPQAWVQWYQYFPDGNEDLDGDGTGGDLGPKWQHRDASGSTKLDFVWLWSGSPDTPNTAAGGYLRHKSGGSGDSEVKPGFRPLTTFTPNYDTTGITDAERGRWVRFGFPIKVASPTNDDGVIDMWVDEELDPRFKNHDVPMYPSGGTNNFYSFGQLMGRANSGFDQTSFTYIDDVLIANRPPVSIVLVLDRSGSMNSLADPGNPGGGTKVQVLRQAVSAILHVIGPYTIPGDKIGLVYFNEDDIPKPLSMGDPILVDITGMNTGSLETIVTTEPTGGRTSVGDGLLAAEREGFNRIANPREIILLVTDGHQNEPILVDEDTTFLNPDIPDLNIGGSEFNIDYEICVISIGVEGPANQVFNHQITTKRCRDSMGNVVEASNLDRTSLGSTEMAEAFANSMLLDPLIGDKLETVKVIPGSLARGEKKIEKFTVSQQDIRLSIIVLWSNPDIASLDVALRTPAPDQIVIDPAPFTKIGMQSKVISFPLPKIDERTIAHKGEWELLINPSAKDTPSSNYGVIILADNKTIATEYSFGGIEFGTGETIPIRVKLKDAGKPILGAKVIAQPASPSAGLGTELSTNTVSLTKLDPSTNDPLSAADQKLAELLKDPKIRAKLLRSPRPGVELKDPDGDGIYTGRYTKTFHDGVYNFTFLVNGNTKNNGNFTRTKELSTRVRIKPNPKTTSIEAKIIEETKPPIAVLTITPFDALGNYLGPGYAKFFKVSTTHGRLVRNILDKLDGSYEQHIVLDDSQDPLINVSFRGQILVNAPLSKLVPRLPVLLIILIIVVLLVILLIVVWLYRRRRASATS